MSRFVIFIIIFIVFTNLSSAGIKNKYCIQVYSSNILDFALENYEKVSSYPYSRLEKIGKSYVIRIEIKNSVKPLKKQLKTVKDKFPDAFIRVCDIIPERIIFSNFPLSKLKSFQEKKNIEIEKKNLSNESQILVKKSVNFPKNQKLYAKKEIYLKPPKEEFEIPEIKLVSDLFQVYKFLPELATKSEEQIFRLKTIKKKAIFEEKINLAPYVKLGINLQKKDKEKIKQNLIEYRNTLPLRDKLSAEVFIKEINDAYKTSYHLLFENKENYKNYILANNLYMNYSNFVSASLYVENFENIYRVISDLKLHKYIGNGLYVSIGNKTYDTMSYDNQFLDHIPNIDSNTFIEISKIFDTSSIYLNIGYRKSLDQFFNFKLSYNLLSDNKNITFHFGINQEAFDTNYTFYAGIKDFIRMDYQYALKNKDLITLNLSLEQFLTQNRKYIGNGKQIYLEYLHKYRLGYPDFSAKIYIYQGFFNEKQDKPDFIDNIVPFGIYQALPITFTEVGIGYLFGINNIGTYTHKYKPFVSTSLAYNTAYKLGYNLYTGINGKLYKYDDLTLGIFLGRGFSSQPYVIYRFELKYKKWF